MPKTKIALKLLFLTIFVTSIIISRNPRLEAANLLWSRVAMPSNGVGGSWVLAAGSDLDCLTLASDGALYCYANPASTPYRLFKSNDGGLSWSYTGRVEDTILDIAVPPDHPTCVYYATATGVFKSVDFGTNFSPLAAVPVISGAGNLEITSLDVSNTDNFTCLVVTVSDNVTGQLGGIYLMKEGQSAEWLGFNFGACDFRKVAFSPGFANDRRFIAVGKDDNDTLFFDCRLKNDDGCQVETARLEGLTALSADIVFPPEYEASLDSDNRTCFISLDTGQAKGGVYRLTHSSAQPELTITNLPIEVQQPHDIGCLTVTGNESNARLMAGSSDSPSIYYSQDAGLTWSVSSKPPSGQSVSGVVVARDNLAFAVTKGPESAFSICHDGGGTWNQTGLIDTRIACIFDLAISPSYSSDKQLFMLTGDVQTSLWSSANDGAWQRVYCTPLAGSEKIDRLLLSQGSADNQTLLMAGTATGRPVIWKSENKGRIFGQSLSIDPDTGDPVNIDAWAMPSSGILYVASFSGSGAMIYRTNPGALDYLDKGQAGNYVINSLALSPDFANDHSIVAGNVHGGVFFSSDGGQVFEPLPFDLEEPPFSGNVNVAFDSGYKHNRIIYASDDKPGKGLYRFTVGQSYRWDSIDASLSSKAMMGPLAVSGSGVLYALNLDYVNSTLGKGGLERCVEPQSAEPVFETVASGLDEGIILKNLWQRDNNVWTLDTTNNKILTYTDSLASSPGLNSPPDGTHGLDPNQAILAWQPVEGATAYCWEISPDAGFSDVSVSHQGNTGAVLLEPSFLDEDTVYFWRVRAYQPISGPWSEVRSFDTCFVSIPALTPVSSTSAPVEPLFHWTACQRADQYRINISNDASFANLVIDRSCSSNAWQCDISLGYNITYYWRVRAERGEYCSLWSEVSSFKTEAEPEATLSAPKPSSPVSATAAEVEPVFRWSEVEGATQYQLVVSANDAFNPLVIDQMCNSNAWISNITLAYRTAYYWKVRAVNNTIQSPWSSVNVFTTRAEPSNGSSSGGSGGSSGGTKTTKPTSTHTPTPSASPSPSSTTTVFTPSPQPSSTSTLTTDSPLSTPAPSPISPSPLTDVSKTDLSAAPSEPASTSPADQRGSSPTTLPVVETAAANPGEKSGFKPYIWGASILVLAALTGLVLFVRKKK